MSQTPTMERRCVCLVGEEGRGYEWKTEIEYNDIFKKIVLELLN